MTQRFRFLVIACLTVLRWIGVGLSLVLILVAGRIFAELLGWI